MARAQAIHDDLRGAYDRMAAELRGLRTEAETRGLNLLGREPVEPAGTPEDDLAVVRDIAASLHDSHVSAGEAEGTRLREEAAAASESLLATAQAQADETLAQAQTEHERLLAQAQTEHERLLTEGQAEHHRLISEAEEERAGILADLQARRELLEARVAELDRSQGEYRERLRALVRQQLSVLDDDGWASTPAGGSEQTPPE